MALGGTKKQHRVDYVARVRDTTSTLRSVKNLLRNGECGAAFEGITIAREQLGEAQANEKWARGKGQQAAGRWRKRRTLLRLETAFKQGCLRK